jgi:hypothetical protein
MRPQRDAEQADNQFIEITAAIPDRLQLTDGPDSDAVSYFVMTRAAEHAWTAINQQLSKRSGALFWIGGPPSTGKTHFLNYVLALDSRTGGLAARTGRRLSLGIAAPALRSAEDLERGIIDMIRGTLGSGDRTIVALSRQLQGGDALRVTLDQAKRQGVNAITIAIDCASADIGDAIPCFEMLARLACAMHDPQLIVVVAARSETPCPDGRAFTVGAAPDEAAAVGIGRARRLDEPTLPAIADAYAGLEVTGSRARQIFPFHPKSVATLLRLGDPVRLIPTVARAAREALVAWRAVASPRRLIWPAELIPAMHETLELRFGQGAYAALTRAQIAATAATGGRDAIAREIVDLLALNHLAGDGQPLDFEAMNAQLMPRGAPPQKPSGDIVANIAAELVKQSGGVILLEPLTGEVRFTPRAAEAPQIAAYNVSLPLIRRFDSASPVAEPEELRAALERLRLALAAALERATHHRETLLRAAQETGTSLSDERERIFAEYFAIVAAGPDGLLSAGDDAPRREACARTIAEYEVLAAIAASVPRIRAMREYLLAMGLHEDLEDDPQRDAALARIETDCRLLLTAVNAAIHAKSPATLDALESRFQRFKWTYVPYYRAAHDRWRHEMDGTAMLAGDGERHLAALRRLNAIPALGPPEGADLSSLFVDLGRRVARCRLSEPLAPEVTPRCPFCNYAVGASSPREELTDLLERVSRALDVKLAALSQSAISRLIRQHDHGHLLDGFLKITQAAQTDALIRVLDDKLAQYLAHLLEDGLNVDGPNPQSSPALRTVGPSKRGPEKLPRRSPRN